MTERKFTNQHRCGTNAYPGRRHAPLSRGQKAEICILAREAYALQFTAQDFAAWRHELQLATVGVASLRACTQAHYLPLKAAFLRAGGESGEALRLESIAEMRDSDLSLARYKLRETLELAGLTEGYAAAICRTQYKCEIATATAAQLWRVIFTLRKRRPAGSRKAAAAAAVQTDP